MLEGKLQMEECRREIANRFTLSQSEHRASKILFAPAKTPIARPSWPKFNPRTPSRR